MAKKETLSEEPESPFGDNDEVLFMPDEDIFPEIDQDFELEEILDPNVVKSIKNGSDK